MPGQHLSDAQQMVFARRFGELVEGLEAAEISNVLPLFQDLNRSIEIENSWRLLYSRAFTQRPDVSMGA